MARATTKKKTAAKKRRAPASVKRRSSSNPVIDIHTHIRIPRLVPFMRDHKPAPQPGMPKPWVPPASASADMQKQSDADIATVIEKGKKPMPGYEGKLTKEQITDLVKYIRALKK